jgi:hypothetical protein
MGAIAPMERALQVARTAAGRAAAKARGRPGGRPRTDPDTLAQARMLYLHSDKTAADVCRAVGIGRRTLCSSLAPVKRRALGTSVPYTRGRQGFFAASGILHVSFSSPFTATRLTISEGTSPNTMNWLRVLQMGLNLLSDVEKSDSSVRINMLHMRPASDEHSLQKS